METKINNAYIERHSLIGSIFDNAISAPVFHPHPMKNITKFEHQPTEQSLNAFVSDIHYKRDH